MQHQSTKLPGDGFCGDYGICVYGTPNSRSRMVTYRRWKDGKIAPLASKNTTSPTYNPVLWGPHLGMIVVRVLLMNWHSRSPRWYIVVGKDPSSLFKVGEPGSKRICLLLLCQMANHGLATQIVSGAEGVKIRYIWSKCVGWPANRNSATSWQFLPLQRVYKSPWS